MINLAIFSDVHSNLEALNVVSDQIKDLSPDITIYLGDTVGYGPNPKECIKGVEDICAKEIKKILGCKSERVCDGRVLFDSDDVVLI